MTRAYQHELELDLYHFLCRSLGQRIAIPQIIHFNIFNVIAIRNVHFAVELSCSWWTGGLSHVLIDR